MNLSLRFGLGASLLAVVAAGCWVRYLLDERQREFELAMSRYQRASAGARSPSPGGFGGMSICMGRTEIEPEYLEIIHRSVPPTPESARVWSALLQPVDMPFTQETPLEAALAFVRKTTRSPDLPSGVILYVDPNGLQEADKTLQSPVQIDLKGVPLSSALSLMLAQLDLAYSVGADGIVCITYVATLHPPSGETYLSPSEADQLRTQLTNIQVELERTRAVLRSTAVEPPR